jgi:hypothetical protein
MENLRTLGFKREIQASFKNRWWIQEGNPKPSFKKESKTITSRGNSGPCAIGGPSINNKLPVKSSPIPILFQFKDS